jgi:hypothetical protein
VKPGVIDEIWRTDGGVTLGIARMAIEALALVGKYLRASFGSFRVAGAAARHDEKGDDVGDLLRIERLDLVAFVGLRVRVGRHVGEVQGPAVARANAEKDRALDFVRAAFTVEPVMFPETGHAIARIALQVIAVTARAVVLIHRPRIRNREAHQLGILGDTIGVTAREAGAKILLAREIK